jgi:hypothetical protein
VSFLNKPLLSFHPSRTSAYLKRCILVWVLLSFSAVQLLSFLHLHTGHQASFASSHRGCFHGVGHSSCQSNAGVWQVAQVNQQGDSIELHGLMDSDRSSRLLNSYSGENCWWCLQIENLQPQTQASRLHFARMGIEWDRIKPICVVSSRCADEFTAFHARAGPVAIL